MTPTLASFESLSWIVSHPYAYPALEVVHIAGIALLFGNLVLFELRVWGIGVALPVDVLQRVALRTSLVGFGIAAASGGVMFASHPGELLANRAFLAKMGLLVAAGVNAAAFHGRGGSRRLDRVARLQTALSLGLWLAIIICGRWIAYL
ncbi:hypothetical protein [Piscinibacter sp. XHJ-5]|uniref:hypothetical protein n=1 Tax=Piscinibacter sp. XHJ-5 TaxID=3037797 RepID=UPI002452E2BA|nr:hypothetical protein [Piscinibacter sp. XHJ-5]